MKVAFILTFPNTPTWNGKSATNDRVHAISRNVPAKRRKELLEKGSFFYRWEDGWTARIECRPCSEARSELKKSDGFCGYTWMVDSLIGVGQILTEEERRELYD